MYIHSYFLLNINYSPDITTYLPLLILFSILLIVLSIDGLVNFSLHIPAIGNILSSILAIGFTNFYFENKK